MSAVGKPRAEAGIPIAVRGGHDVARLEQSEPILVEAEGSTYELLARGAALLPGLIRKFWDIAAHYKINSFSGVPTVYSSLLQVPRSDRR